MSESPTPSTPRPLLRRWLAPGLAMVAVVAVAAGAVVLARHRDSGGPAAAPPQLKLAQAEAGSAAAAADSIGYAAPTIVGPLPSGPARARVRTLPAGAAEQAAVTALARALGLSGTPTRDGQGWRLVAGADALEVDGTGGMPWAFGPASGGSVRCHVISADKGPLCPPAVGIPPQPAPRGNGTKDDPVPSPGAPANDAPDAPVPPDGSVGSGGGPVTGPVTGSGSGPGVGSGGSTGSAGSGSDSKPGTGPAVDPGKPVPVEPLPLPARPTDAEALAAAQPVLAALGLSGARVQRVPGQVSVLVDPVVDGLPTTGFGTALTVAPGGDVTTGSGWLGHPAAGAEYPLVPAADALKDLPVRDIARLCGTKVCAPLPMEITGATLGLLLRWDTTAAPLLVPAWRYTVRGGTEPLVVVAVQPAYLGGDREGRPNVPGGAPPVPADPSGAANNDLPGQVEPATPLPTHTR
jgi:hypothetical protein